MGQALENCGKYVVNTRLQQPLVFLSWSMTVLFLMIQRDLFAKYVF